MLRFNEANRSSASSSRYDAPDLVEIDRVVAKLGASDELHLPRAQERRRHTLAASEHDREINARWLDRVISLGDSQRVEVSPLQQHRAVALQNPNALGLLVHRQQSTVVDAGSDHDEIDTLTVCEVQSRARWLRGEYDEG